MFQRKYFILAPSYHGATLLAKLLDSHPRVICLGDTYPANSFDQVCGCRVRISKCAFWQKIKAELNAVRYSNLPFLLPAHPGYLGGPIDRLLFDNLPIGTLQQLVPASCLQTFATDYRSFVMALYSQFEDTGPTVFVDGFKLSSRVKALLCAGERIDGIIHLVRNAEDFVKSSMHISGGGVRHLARAALSWRRRHAKIRALGKSLPYHLVNYESLCSDVDGTLAGLFEFLEVDQMTSEDLRREPARPWHYVGNSSMFNFDWTIRAKRHSVTAAETLLIGKIAGTSKRDQRLAAA